jgi:hypothetical protein
MVRLQVWVGGKDLIGELLLLRPLSVHDLRLDKAWTHLQIIRVVFS